jgi:hypothetical protein
MEDLKVAFEEFRNDLSRDVHVSGEPEPACFFQRYSAIAAENGDCIDLTYTPVRKEGAQGFKIDGYAINTELGELHLAICDYRADDELQTLNQGQIDILCKGVERFLKSAQSGEYINSLEETSPAFEAAYPIFYRYNLIHRIRVIIFSNARLVARKKYLDSKEISGKTFTFNLLDFTRYGILNTGHGPEPIEIDLLELNKSPLPCLCAYTGSSDYASYLVVLPGDLLAKIYGLYGPRLLEQNVRTFLQAKTKVNKGIINTIEESPEMFFAYNNGLTATASDIEIDHFPGGASSLRTIKDLQIVNGGQTTASILYSKDMKNFDLSNVFVQMKLSVVSKERVEKIVPKISRYANTQNKISEADFFSSHPFHLEMEKTSRRLTSPQKEGSFVSSKWFYERARGQYKDKLAYGKTAEKKKFETEFPANQLIDKTDLAKYQLTFDCKPHIVSLGAQKCFMEFAQIIGKAWIENPLTFNDGYFKDLIAKTILFRWTDNMIAHSEWYKEDRGYKAQIVTYTVAWIVNHANKIGEFSIDLQQIWNKQDLPEGLKRAIELCAPAIAIKIKDAPAHVKNVGEYCKNQSCWAAVSGLQIHLSSAFKTALIEKAEIRQLKKDEVAVKVIDKEIEFEKHLIELFPHLAEIVTFAHTKKLLSPKSNEALIKLTSGKINMNIVEKDALKKLFIRMEEEGYEFP